MNLERTGQWLGILANIGVLLGFLAVAYQLRLSWDSLQQASNQQFSSLAADAEVALMGDTGYAAYAKSIVNPSALTYEELMQFWTYLSIAQMNAQQAYVDYREGRVSEQGWLYARDTFLFYFDYPMGRVWFEESKRSAEGTEISAFYQAVEAAMDDPSQNRTSQWFLRMHQRAKTISDAADPGP